MSLIHNINQLTQSLPNKVPIQDYTHLSRQRNFTVCVMSPLFGRLNKASMIVNFIEINKIFGAEHFTFYVFKVDSKVNAVLEYYEKHGMIEVIVWNVPALDLHYGAQLLVINDCLYRNLYKAKYLAFIDRDEYIVPHAMNSWDEIIKNINVNLHQEQCGYMFRNVFFTSSEESANVDPTNNTQVAQRKLNQSVNILSERDDNSENAYINTLKDTAEQDRKESYNKTVFVHRDKSVTDNYNENAKDMGSRSDKEQFLQQVVIQRDIEPLLNRVRQMFSWPPPTRAKVMVNTKYAQVMGIHYLVKCLRKKKTVVVPFRLALLHHYRHPTRWRPDCGRFMMDNTLVAYHDRIVQAVVQRYNLMENDVLYIKSRNMPDANGSYLLPIGAEYRIKKK